MRNDSKLKIIPYSRQSINNTDISCITKVLKSDFLTTGPEVIKFEKNIKNFCDSKYALSFNSATSALHAACFSVGIKKNDYVWTSAISFVASANSAIYCGAKIDFLDIDLNTFNICLEKLENKLSLTKKKYLPKAIIIVHLGGFPLDIQRISKLSKKYKFKIIEDASHAIGAVYKNDKIGSCKYSDICIFSLHPVKIITSGEGGLATCNNQELNKKMKLLREHGIERDKKKFKNQAFSPWIYEQQYLGYNYRLSDIHAALGLNQLKRINKFINRRNYIAGIYKKELKNLPIKFQTLLKDSFSTYHLFIILVEKNIRNKLFKYLRNRNILVNIHYIPIFIHPYHKPKNFNKNKFRNSLEYYSRAISLPNYYNLSQKDLKKVIILIKKFYKKYGSKKN